MLNARPLQVICYTPHSKIWGKGILVELVKKILMHNWIVMSSVIILICNVLAFIDQCRYCR